MTLLLPLHWIIQMSNALLIKVTFIIMYPFAKALYYLILFFLLWKILLSRYGLKKKKLLGT